MKTFKINNEPKIETGFSIPDTYFEDFSSKVMLKISKEETKTIALYPKRKILFYAAAAVLAIGLMIPVYNYFENPLQKIDDKSLENYLVDSSTILNDEFAYLLDNKDIEKVNIKLNIEDKTIENELTNNTDLEQYLLN